MGTGVRWFRQAVLMGVSGKRELESRRFTGWGWQERHRWRWVINTGRMEEVRAAGALGTGQ